MLCTYQCKPPFPHPEAVWGISHQAKPNCDNAPHTGTGTQVHTSFIGMLLIYKVNCESNILKIYKIIMSFKTTVYTRVQVERVYKSNPIFEAKNTTFLEKV